MIAAPVIWHELECGGYAADLPLWEELAGAGPGPVLDIGCGSGRVAVSLARRGHPVTGLDRDEELIAALRERARELPVEAVVGDATGFDLGREFGLVLAPMQLIQLLDGPAERLDCLRSLARHLAPGGLLALAIVESLPAAAGGPPPLPDAREIDEWVYSSLPLETVIEPQRLIVRRLRQTVSPAGELSDELDEIALATLSAATLEREAVAVGLRPAGRRLIESTADHVGSTVVLLEVEK